jgi:hypothetical protein
MDWQHTYGTVWKCVSLRLRHFRVRVRVRVRVMEACLRKTELAFVKAVPLCSRLESGKNACR